MTVSREYLVEPAVSPILVVFNEKTNPVTDGAFKLTDPVNPRLDTVRMDVPESPATKLPGLGGEALIVKSPPTLMETNTE